MTNTTSKNMDAVELTMIEVRASGPVTRDNIAAYLLDQMVGCDTAEQAEREADRAIKHGMEVGWLELYDGNVGEYVICAV